MGPAPRPVGYVDHVAQNPQGLSVQGEKIDIEPGVVPPPPPLPSNMSVENVGVPPPTLAEPVEDKENVGTYPPKKFNRIIGASATRKTH